MNLLKGPENLERDDSFSMLFENARSVQGKLLYLFLDHANKSFTKTLVSIRIPLRQPIKILALTLTLILILALALTLTLTLILILILILTLGNLSTLNQLRVS